MGISFAMKGNWFAVISITKILLIFFFGSVVVGEFVQPCHFTDQFSSCNMCHICYAECVDDDYSVGCLVCPFFCNLFDFLSSLR